MNNKDNLNELKEIVHITFDNSLHLILSTRISIKATWFFRTFHAFHCRDSQTTKNYSREPGQVLLDLGQKHLIKCSLTYCLAVKER